MYTSMFSEETGLAQQPFWGLGSVHLKSVGGGPENGGQARAEFM